MLNRVISEVALVLACLLVIAMLAVPSLGQAPPPDPRHWNCVQVGKNWDCTEGPSATTLAEKKKPRKGFIRGIMQPAYKKAIKPAAAAVKKAVW